MSIMIEFFKTKKSAAEIIKERAAEKDKKKEKAYDEKVTQKPENAVTITQPTHNETEETEQQGKGEKDHEVKETDHEDSLREGLKRFRLLQAEVVNHYREIGLPLTENLRLKYEWFAESGHHSKNKIGKDMAYAENLRKIFKEEDAEKPAHIQEMKFIASFSEEVIPIIFHFSSKTKGFAVFRTVESEDYKNGIDLEVVLKKDGRVIFGFDATNSSKDIVYGITSKSGGKPSKFERTVERNEQEVIMDYAVTLGKDGKFYPESIKISRGVPPLVHLIISREEVAEFIKDLATIDKKEIESYCDKFAERLIFSIYESLNQIKKKMRGSTDHISELIDVIQTETGIEPKEEE